MIQLEALYKGQKEKLDAAFAAIVAEREELEANVAAKELASKRSDADAEELIKVGCDHHVFFRLSLPVFCGSVSPISWWLPMDHLVTC